MRDAGTSARPYPVEWERHLVLNGNWKIFVRPVQETDEALVLELLSRVTREDLRLRFFAAIKQFSHPFLVSLTQLDYAKAMAFIAFDEATGETLGVVRLHRRPAGDVGEYAILLRSDLKGRGLGWALMQLIVEYARSEGLKQIVGQIMHENAIMLQMCREMGFDVKPDPEDYGIYDVTLVL